MVSIRGKQYADHDWPPEWAKAVVRKWASDNNKGSLGRLYNWTETQSGALTGYVTLSDSLGSKEYGLMISRFNDDDQPEVSVISVRRTKSF